MTVNPPVDKILATRGETAEQGQGTSMALMRG